MQSHSQSLGFSRTNPLRSTAVARLNWSKDLQKRLSGGDQDKSTLTSEPTSPSTESSECQWSEGQGENSADLPHELN